MLVVAGLSLSNLKPRVWDAESPYYLPNLKAVMVSYADFHKAPLRRKWAMERGLHAYLGVPDNVKIYLDNGSFFFLSREGGTPQKEYEEFVEAAKPDWRPVPQDFIPVPAMTTAEQQDCLIKTMNVNRAFSHDGYVPVIHISRVLGEYITQVKAHDRLAAKPSIALGGIVPNLLRASKAMSHKDMLAGLRSVRNEFAESHIHVFGIGGTATLHIAALLGFDSADSSGWRNRAARGMVQLPGSGERTAAALGNWRGRSPSKNEWARLRRCKCPACQTHGVRGLKVNGQAGFCNRAVHNLWVLLEEVRWLERWLGESIEAYVQRYRSHLDNTTYLPLIEEIVDSLRKPQDIQQRDDSLQEVILSR